MRVLLLLTVLIVTGACASAPDSAPAGGPVPAGYRLVYEQRFEDSTALGEFWPSISSAWTIGREEFKGHDVARPGQLELVEPGQGDGYAPPHRSPHRLALLREFTTTSFVLEAEMKQTGREYGHRDLCLAFGFRSPSEYYYVHLATTPDDHACNVFLVDNAARRRTAEVPEQGVEWGTDIWHTVRLERDTEAGTIRVFFDDMQTPVLETTDLTHSRGHLGFGSFDDTGAFRAVRIWAPEYGPALFTGNPFRPQER